MDRHFCYVQAAAFLLFLAVLAIFRQLHSGWSGRFGRDLTAAFLLFSAVLAMFRRLHLYY